MADQLNQPEMGTVDQLEDTGAGGQTMAHDPGLEEEQLVDRAGVPVDDTGETDTEETRKVTRRVTHAKRVHIRETYAYELNLSENPTLTLKQEKGNPRGFIEVEVPYDGDVYFTRNTYKRLENEPPYGGSTDPEEQGMVNAGLLQIVERRVSKQNDRQVLRPTRTIPLKVPVDAEEFQDMAILIADRYRCVLREEYVPDDPMVDPLWAGIEVYDDHVVEILPFITSSILIDWLRPDRESAPTPDSLRSYFRGTPDYQDTSLILELTFNIGLPADLLEEVGDREPSVTLKTLSLEWPTALGGTPEAEGLLDRDRISFQHLKRARKLGKWEWEYECGGWLYSPGGGQKKGTVEMYDIPLYLRPSSNDKDVRYQPWHNYITRARIKVNTPGKFYQVRWLKGQVHFQIEGLLLSGHQVSLLDETGKHVEQVGQEPVRYTTDIYGDLEIDLESSFKRRETVTYWEMHFDGIELNRTRVDDVIGALSDLGYRVVDREPVAYDPSDPSSLSSYIIQCERLEVKEDATATLQLLLRRERADDMHWELDVPGDVSARLTSDVPADHLVIHVRGHLRNGSASLSIGLAQLQDRLKKLFYSLAVAR